jgi:hypothetical protein
MDHTRSKELIRKADLRRLARLAQTQRADFFERHPEYAILYRKRLLCSALVGDAALHYINGSTGIHQFDVWSFYAEHPDAPFPFHVIDHMDFGPSRFGRADDAPKAYVGRRVELQGRSLEADLEHEPLTTLQRYLRAGATPSARELAQKAVVIVEPEPLAGMQAWPTLAVPAAR